MSLGTADYRIAAAQVADVIPYLRKLQGLRKKAEAMTRLDIARVVNQTVQQVITKLVLAREPWRADPASPGELEEALLESALGFSTAGETGSFDEHTAALRQQIETEQPSSGELLAKHVFAKSGARLSEEDLRKVAMDLLKFRVGLRVAISAASRGDSCKERSFIEYYSTDISGGPGASASATPTMLLSEAIAEYTAEKLAPVPTPAWGEAAAAANAATFRDFIEILGDMPVGTLDRAALLRYRDVISKLPSNRIKRYRSASINELLSMDIPAAQLPKPRTLQEALVRVSAFLRWCRDIKGILKTDPMVGVNVQGGSVSYAPFTREDLKRIFEDNAAGQKEWQFWIPRIALLSGARQTEIAQLRPVDVMREDGVWFLAITNQGEGQSVKTAAGIRKVPLHSKLVEMGFLSFVEEAKEEARPSLFIGAKSANGQGHSKKSAGGTVSKWFGRRLRSLGIGADVTGRRKVFHSFRHTAITAAAAKGCSLAAMQQVFGHEKSVLGESATYIDSLPLSVLAEVIEALDFDIALDAKRGDGNEDL